MSFMSDAVSKMMGVGTAAEYRMVALDEFCNSNDLANLSIEQEYKIDPSRRTPRFKRQVLFCRANQQTQNVALVISYDEDTGSTEGALIPLRSLTKHRTLASEYKSGTTYASSFFSYVVNELGVAHAVGARESAALSAKPNSLESASSSQRGDETTIVPCPSCGRKNKVPTDGLEPKVGRAKCGHCSFKWLLHSQSSSSVITENVGESDKKSITYKMVSIEYSASVYRVKDNTFSTLTAAKQYVDASRSSKPEKPDQTISDQDRAKIIEKVMDLGIRKDRRPLVKDALIMELKELGYLVFSLPNGKFRLEFRANVVPAGDSITDLRAVLETHGWREKNYGS